MRTLGNDHAGYSVGYDSATASFRIVAWGFWPVDLALGFEAIALAAYRDAPARSSLTLDVSGLKPMRDEAQKAVVAVLKTLKSIGVPKISVVTTSHLTKLQFMRIAAEAACADRTAFI